VVVADNKHIEPMIAISCSQERGAEHCEQRMDKVTIFSPPETGISLILHTRNSTTLPPNTVPKKPD
jgi:hypothetical protein